MRVTESERTTHHRHDILIGESSCVCLTVAISIDNIHYLSLVHLWDLSTC